MFTKQYMILFLSFTLLNSTIFEFKGSVTGECSKHPVLNTFKQIYSEQLENLNMQEGKDEFESDYVFNKDGSLVKVNYRLASEEGLDSEKVKKFAIVTSEPIKLIFVYCNNDYEELRIYNPQDDVAKKQVRDWFKGNEKLSKCPGDRIESFVSEIFNRAMVYNNGIANEEECSDVVSYFYIQEIDTILQWSILVHPDSKQIKLIIRGLLQQQPFVGKPTLLTYNEESGRTHCNALYESMERCSTGSFEICDPFVGYSMPQDLANSTEKRHLLYKSIDNVENQVLRECLRDNLLWREMRPL